MVTKRLVMKDDIMFKAFFSKKGNERFLKDFLNAILGKEIKIKRVIHDLRLEQLAREQKYGVLDIDVELENGEIINIEMQMNDHKNMEKRTTFYASKKITEQFAPKAQYSQLKKVIVIARIAFLLNFPFKKRQKPIATQITSVQTIVVELATEVCFRDSNHNTK